MNDRTLKLVASIGVPVICLAVLVYFLTSGQTQPAAPGPTTSTPTGGEVATGGGLTRAGAEAQGPVELIDGAGLKRVALSARQYALSPRPIYSESRWDSSFAKARGEPGLVHANARISTVGSYAGKKVICAIDADSADAKTPNLIRFDFSGKREFTEAVVLPLTGHSEENYFQATFGPKNVVVRQGDAEIPVCIEGDYTRMEATYRWCEVYLGSAIERTVTIGETSYPVRFVDGNSDLDFADKYRRPSTSPYGGYEQTSADTVIIGSEDGSFDDRSTSAFYGQPIAIGGGWFRLDLPDGEQAIEATALNLKGGKLKLEADSWYAIVENDAYYFELNGGPTPVALPVGDYHLRYFMSRPREDASARGPILAVGTPYGRDQTRPNPDIHIKEGETFTLGVGAPLQARVEANKGRQDRQVYLSLALTDASGRRVSSLSNAKGSSPKAPTIKVFGADGKQVHSATLEYG
jgi:hypothetical protein